LRFQPLVLCGHLVHSEDRATATKTEVDGNLRQRLLDLAEFKLDFFIQPGDGSLLSGRSSNFFSSASRPLRYVAFSSRLKSKGHSGSQFIVNAPLSVAANVQV
jgi:hypothetical protein